MDLEDLFNLPYLVRKLPLTRPIVVGRVWDFQLAFFA